MGSGGAGGTGSTGTSTPSYGSKGAAIGGAVGGAAAGAGLLYWYRHTHATLVGCVGDDGTTLLNEKDNHSYALVNNGSTLKPGQRVELKGKKVKSGSAFEVKKLNKEYGSCKEKVGTLQKPQTP
jgi:hypothetical protein